MIIGPAQHAKRGNLVGRICLQPNSLLPTKRIYATQDSFSLVRGVSETIHQTERGVASRG
jgi:hypothetical protein